MLKKIGGILIVAVLIFFIMNSLSVKQKDVKDYSFLFKKGILAVDSRSNSIDLKEVKGKKYFQWIDPANYKEVLFLLKVNDEWGWRNDLHIFAITEKKDDLFSKIGRNNIKAFVLEDKNKVITSKLNASYSKGGYLLIDEKNQLINSGVVVDDYERMPRIQIERFVNNYKPSLSKFIPVGKNVKDIEWLKTAGETLLSGNNKKNIVIVLFKSFCLTCLEGDLLDKLKKISLNGNTGVAVVFSNDFSYQDINNFVGEFKIDFSVISADTALSAKWEDLKSEFFESELNDIVFTLSQNGDIAAAADRQCGCFPGFFKSLEERK